MIKKLLRKLKARRGELLLESLVSVLIVTLSGLLLATLIVSAARLNKTAREADSALQTETEAAETGVWETNGSVKIGGNTLNNVISFNTSDSSTLTSYRLNEGG